MTLGEEIFLKQGIKTSNYNQGNNDKLLFIKINYFCLSKYSFKIVKTSDKSGKDVYSNNEIIQSMKNHLQISKIKIYIAM